MNAQKFKQGILSDKSKRGWWFSVVFMIIVVGLILFLTYVKIVDETIYFLGTDNKFHLIQPTS